MGGLESTVGVMYDGVYVGRVWRQRAFKPRSSGRLDGWFGAFALKSAKNDTDHLRIDTSITGGIRQCGVCRLSNY